MNEPQRRLVTIKTFAEMISLGERTVSRLIAGGLPVVYTSSNPRGTRHGRGVRIDPDQGIEYLKNRPPPGSPPPVRRGRPRKAPGRKVLR
jgi:hypothetical protein